MRKRYINHLCERCKKVTKHRIRPGEKLIEGTGLRVQLMKCLECR